MSEEKSPMERGETRMRHNRTELWYQRYCDSPTLTERNMNATRTKKE